MTTEPVLSPLEIAVGRPLPRYPSPQRLTADPVRRAGPHLPPLEALEAVILPLLQRPPCVVSFSGGRDSSAVLAVAVGLARREGLPLPIPTTLVFPDDERTREDDYQRDVLEWLGLEEQVRIELRDELDLLGPVGRETIAAHGPYWPPNAHLQMPIIEAARGGSMLTGVGGDEIFSARAPARLRARWRARRLTRRHVAEAFARKVPWDAPARRIHARLATVPSWVTPDAAREAKRLIAIGHQAESEPSIPEGLRVFPQTRYYEMVHVTLQLFGRERDVVVKHAFLDEDFLYAYTETVPERGFPTRSAAMAAMFGELLPESVINRRSKATFSDVLLGPASLAFAQACDGTGIDPAIVDLDELRRVWQGPRPPLASALLLEAAWLAAQDDPAVTG